LAEAGGNNKPKSVIGIRTRRKGEATLSKPSAVKERLCHAKSNGGYATTLFLEARSAQVIEVLAYCMPGERKEVIRESLFLGMPSNQRAAGHVMFLRTPDRERTSANLVHINYSPNVRRSNAMSNEQKNDTLSTPSTRKMTGIIDVHSHIITNLGSQAPMDKLPAWSIEQSLSLMDANGIAASVLSLPDSADHAKGPEACQLARRINEQLADIVSKHPTRFGAMATLPALAATDGLLEEMAYALDTLKLDGVATTTSIDDIYLGDTRYDQWFEEMNRRGVTLFVHPVPAKASRSVDLGIDVSILEFMFDTTRMLTNMIFSGAKNRFLKIKIVSTHGGGTIPYLMTRIETLEKVFGPGKGRAHLSPEEICEGLASFYYDLTAATSPAQLFALQQMVPLSHLVMGFDNPFMPGWTFPPAIQDMQRWNGFSDIDVSSIAHRNAESLYPALAGRLQQFKAA
jgi:predicted TIM-barrel fold metal-dependent hydrolase